MKRITMLAAVAILAGCASTPVVHTDHDPAAEFAGYRTYAWRQQPAMQNPLLKQRLIAAIDAELGNKGWTLAPEEQADVALVGNVASHEEQTLDVFYNGPDWSGWGWQRDAGAGIGYRTAQVHTYKVGTLVLDMFDARTRQAVWRATAEGTVPDSPEKVNAAMRSAVTKMFRDFPPGSSPSK